MGYTIKDERTFLTYMKIGELSTGDAFEYCGDVYVKTLRFDDCDNVFNLTNRYSDSLKDDTIVILCDLEFTIRYTQPKEKL